MACPVPAHACDDERVRRFLALVTLAASVFLAPTAALAGPVPHGTSVIVIASSAASASATTAAGTPTNTDPPITLPEGKSLTECISSNPKPGCGTSRDTDAHQIAVLSVMFAAMVFIGWRITRSIRRRDRSATPVP